MSLQTKRILLRFLIFAAFGLLLEVFFTGVGALRSGHLECRGHTSPWMMFDYGLMGIILMPMARPMIRRRIPLLLRAAVYMVGIFVVEFVSGWIFDLCGLDIWDYSHLPLNICGYITLTYAPFWYAYGLAAEFLYRRFDAFALVWAAGLTADDIQNRALT